METSVKQASTQQLQLVTFKLGNEEYGLDILHVQEINKIVDITEVPQAPSFVEGIINLRGKVIPVIDLRKRLGMEEKPDDQHTRIIVAKIDGKTTGFRVDAVKEVLRISSGSLESPPEVVAGSNSEFFKSVAKLENRLLILIDLGKLLSREEKSTVDGLAA